jgi:MFS family permease
LPQRLPRTVIILGLVSFFNDFASDIVVPLIPILLATVLSSGPVALGLIEGVADAVASFLKLWSGRHSDQLHSRRKGLTLSGYILSNLARPLLGLAGNWPLVLVLRSLDRVGKGVRSASRDALVVDATPPEMRGYAFGFHRALDNGGAVTGSLAAAGILAYSALSLPQVILLSAIPGFIAVLTLLWGVRETTAVGTRPRAELAPLSWRGLPSPMRRYLLVLGLFTFARASETFIVLFGFQLHIGVVELLLLWAALNLAKTATSTWGGRLADKLGRGTLLLMSWTAFAVSFLLLGNVTGNSGLWAVTIVYGLFMGMSEGAERALVGDFSSVGERGTAFGWYHMILGLTAVPAGAVFGAIWHYQSAAMAFFFASGMAALCVLLLRAWVWPHFILNQSVP